MKLFIELWRISLLALQSMFAKYSISMMKFHAFPIYSNVQNLGPYQISMMNIWDVWQGPEYSPGFLWMSLLSQYAWIPWTRNFRDYLIIDIYELKSKFFHDYGP